MDIQPLATLVDLDLPDSEALRKSLVDSVDGFAAAWQAARALSLLSLPCPRTACSRPPMRS